MPVYFFHLHSRNGYERDTDGVEYRDVEAAYIGAHQAALDISVEMLRDRVDILDVMRWSFDIANTQGVVLHELPFAEVLRSGSKRGPRTELHAQLQINHKRVERLQSDVHAGYQTSLTLLSETTRLLRLL